MKSRILLFASVLGALILLLTMVSGHFRLPFWKEKRITSVYSSLIESTEDSLLNSSEYTLKVIFPYDFIEPGDRDAVPWRTMQRLYNSDSAAFLLKDNPELYPDREVPSQWKYASVYRMCRENGLDPAGDPDSFLVVSAGIKAGFRLLDENNPLFSLETGEDKKLNLRLPPAGITDIIIYDRPEGGQEYPEVAMTPQQWSRLIEALMPEIVKMAEDKGILREAEVSAVSLLSELFKGAGYDVENITFSL